MILLYTAPSPNGYKVSIALEELQLPYQVESLDMIGGEQRREEFLCLSPNAKIPTILDEDTGISVFESGAILLYLAEKSGRLLPPPGSAERWQVVQWLMFQMAGIGPMQGQSVVFYRYIEKTPAAISRYHHECQRLWGVVDRQLRKRPYIAGDQYSIADIAIYPWYVAHPWAGLQLEEYPAVAEWAQRIAEREAVKRGMQVPYRLQPERLDTEEREQLIANSRHVVIR